MPPKARLHKDKGKLKSLPKTVVKNSPVLDPQPSTSDTENQVHFEVELLWCIQQLQTALSNGKLNQKQMQESTKTLNSLMSNSTPIIRKRQLMRLCFGDYRAKMADEQAKYSKKNEKIVYLPYKPNSKSVFVKKAPFLNSDKDFKFNFSVPTNSEENTLESALESMEIKENNSENSNVNSVQSGETINDKDFHFAPSNNGFRFNFSEE